MKNEYVACISPLPTLDDNDNPLYLLSAPADWMLQDAPMCQKKAYEHLKEVLLIMQDNVKEKE